MKSRNRSTISDEHLENSLRIAVTSIKPDIDRLVFQKNIKYPTNKEICSIFVLKLYKKRMNLSLFKYLYTFPKIFISVIKTS